MSRVILVSLLFLLSGCNVRSGGPPIPETSMQLSPTDICDGFSIESERSACYTKVLEADARLSAPKGFRSKDEFGFAIGMFVLSYGWYALYFGFGLVVATFVYRDARRRPWLVLRLSPILWAGLALIDPPIAVLAYWAMHYSPLAKNLTEANNTIERAREP